MISKSEIFRLCLDFSRIEALTSQRFSLLICILFEEFDAQFVATAHKITCAGLTMTNAKQPTKDAFTAIQPIAFVFVEILNLRTKYKLMLDEPDEFMRHKYALQLFQIYCE